MAQVNLPWTDRSDSLGFKKRIDFHANLKSGGIPHKEEVVVFTIIDLIGNVGGFLGLLLGASLLSIYDKGIDIIRDSLKKAKE